MMAFQEVKSMLCIINQLKLHISEFEFFRPTVSG